MRNRLPLPIATIKELHHLREQHTENLWIANPLYNIMRDIVDYEYMDAIRGLKILQKDHPDLMNYTKHIRAILQAKQRYDDIEGVEK